LDVAAHENDGAWLLQRAPVHVSEIFTGYEAVRASALAALENTTKRRPQREAQIDQRERWRERLGSRVEHRHASALRRAATATAAKHVDKERAEQEYLELKHLVGPRRRRLEQKLTKLTGSAFAFRTLETKYGMVITGPAIIPALMIHKKLQLGESRVDRGDGQPYVNNDVPWTRVVTNLTELEELVDDLMGTPAPKAEGR
jgi:hypothetical protein